MDGFADWWLQVDTMLKDVESKVGQSEVNLVSRLRVKSIKLGWGKMKGECSSYKIQVRSRDEMHTVL